MAANRKARAREAQLAFEALSIEGSLLSPEWLSKVAQLQAGMQAEADYRIHKGLNLRDEIGRYWRIAQAHWIDFKSSRDVKADPRITSERFVLALFREAFDFTSLVTVTPAVLAERASPIGQAALGGRVPLVIAPADSGLDTLASVFGDGNRKRSAFGVAQEYLNAQEGALWGVASDGCTLRVVRDNASLTRPAWIEADLQRIFTEERYADFAALWLLCHETRFGREGQPVTECALEVWRNAGGDEGTRAREHLRRGVEEALVALGQGFLAHVDNHLLRTALQSGSLAPKGYFNQLLRLIYRLIFLLTVEERGLLHPDGTHDAVKALYAQGYSLRRLRERSVKRSAHDRFSDLWEAIKIVCRGLAAGEPRLGLPALSGIFDSNQCPALDTAKLENRALLLAVFKLAWLREDGSLSRVNWRDMGPEELGSVYESLLELVPQITKDGRQFAFATGGETKGNARKTTGSYYTPDSLVQALLDSALEPVIADTIAKSPGNAIEALLGLSIVDPACGSGHFLLAAARRLAAHVARLQANGTPSAADYRHALRQVVSRCIFGVDLNPMAIELCKVGLWMEAIEPGLPLTFLNSHIQHGNALLGTTPELMTKGVPDAAWDPIEGDDKKTASALKKRNKKAAEGQRSFDTLWSKPVDSETQTVTRAVTELDAASDASVEALVRKEQRWDGILGSPEYRHQKFVADAWCAAFVWLKQPGELTDAAPTNELWRQLRDGRGTAAASTRKAVGELADEYRFFHWHLQFPQVFAKGGFDVVLGNPPWERVKLQEQEFFASRSEEIARAANAAARKKLIARLAEEDPSLWADWCAASRRAEGESHWIRQSGRYPLCGKGDVNTYAVFAEHNRSVLGPFARAGFVVPSGIATDDTTKEYFEAIVQHRQLVSLYDFQSGPGLFGQIGHARFKFALVTLGQHAAHAELVFFARTVAELSDPHRRVRLAAQDFQVLNPNTRTCPAFRSRRDAEITRAVYQAYPILVDDDRQRNPWGVTIRRYLDMNKTETLALCSKIRDAQHELPVVEAKLVHQFEHRFGDYADKPAGAAGTSLPEVALASLRNPTYCVQPRYWIGRTSVVERLSSDWRREWLLVWRDICRSFDERTVIATVVPLGGTDFTLRVAKLEEPRLTPLLLGALNSFIFDFVARQKLGGTHLSDYVTKQLPVPSPEIFECQFASVQEPLRDWLLPRVLELTYTAWDLEPFARDVGYEGPPFRWDPERRFLLRCELDAAFFHLYGRSREETEYVMETFTIVRKNDEKAGNGRYRTKDTILAIFDEMSEAARTGKPYQTRLSPPPADPRVAHHARDHGKVIQLPARPAARPQPATRPAVALSPARGREVPAWTPGLLSAVAAKTGLNTSAGRWGTTLRGADLGIVALAAVLRKMDGPASRDEIERAVVLAVLPSLLQSKFDSETGATWGRAIGTANMGVTSVVELSIPWAEVLRRAVVEHILHVAADGRWSAGADIDDAPSAELDARAMVSLAWLASMSGEAEDDHLFTQLHALRAA